MKVFLRFIILIGALSMPGRGMAQMPKTATTPHYIVTDVGTLGGTTSEAYGINASGLVVGHAETKEGQNHAFLFFPTGYAIRATGRYVAWPNGKPTLLDLTPRGTARSEARAINSFGIVAGSVFTPKGQQATVWNSDFEPTLGPDGAYTINDGGAVGGVNLLWKIGRNNATLSAPFAGETRCYVYGITQTGETVGAELFDDTHGTTRPFLRRAAKTETLVQPFSKGASAAAYAINSKGQIVGTDGRKAFLWQNGKLTDLNQAMRSSVAYAINEQGQIVGQADVSLRDQSLRAVLWENAKMTDLNTEIASDCGWTLDEARGINQSGQICGTGTFGGKRHAFLLTPQSQRPK